MNNETAKNYLRDLSGILREKALEAKRVKSMSNEPYDLGYLMAYYDVVSLLQTQAEVFGIPLEELSLSDLNPDSDLLGEDSDSHL